MEVISIISDFLRNDGDSAIMLLLCASVGCGFLCKRTKNVEYKKWIGTIFGVSCLFVLNGFIQLGHMLAIGTTCAFVIVYSGKRKCHIAAFVLMFSYLGIFRTLSILYPNNKSMNMSLYVSLAQMMLTCKFVGIAFEIRNSFIDNEERIKNGKPSLADDEGVIDPSIPDILHYGFSFFGSHSGPYIRYRTFDDYLHLPFSRVVGITGAIKKVAESLIMGLIFVLIHEYWPLEYTLTNEFRDCSMAYKALFTIIQFQRFFFWLTSGLRMSEAACAAAGLGAYPVQGVNKTSHGPTEQYAQILKISYSEAKKLEYDFNTLNSMDVKEVQTSPWMSVQTRSWNKSFQYFMGTYIFNSIPDISGLKNLRIFITIFVSAFWHGLEPGYYIGMLTMPSYMVTERLYRTLYKSLTGWRANLLLCCMFVAKFFILSYGTIAFKMLDLDKILIYLSSMQYLPYVFHFCMHVLGLAVVASIKKSKMID